MPGSLLELTRNAIVEIPTLNANDVMVPVDNTGKTISLMKLSGINVKEFETLRGQRLSFFEKIGFKLDQRKLRKKLEADGTMKSKNLAQYLRMAKGKTGFHLGGFALGFFLLILGIPIAYLINDDKKQARVKWAWIGLATWTVIIISLALLSGGVY